MITTSWSSFVCSSSIPMKLPGREKYTSYALLLQGLDFGVVCSRASPNNKNNIDLIDRAVRRIFRQVHKG
jgi:hypothetical protein